MASRTLLLVAALVAVCALTYARDVEVDSTVGRLKGRQFDLHNGKTVNAFTAVKYAQPPVGERRFRISEPLPPFDDTYDARYLGPACPQGLGLLGLTHPLWSSLDEDCLHMNIYTPSNMTGGPYAVMIWFHGGGYTGSANIQYTGYFLAARDVIVVVPNYRLGIFGFASTDDPDYRGNYGLWDQNLAMRWVQDNIASLGGDPTRVTLFGQSAGASSSGLHITSPHSRDLFAQAIYESGTEIALWAVNWPEMQPTNYTEQVASKMDCYRENAAEMMDCLREIPWEDLYDVEFDCAPGWFCQGFAPVIDGPGGFIPEEPSVLRAKGEFANVTLLGGHNNKDGSLYTIAFIPEANEGGVNRTKFNEYLRTKLIDIFAPRLESEEVVEDMYQAMNFQYTAWPELDNLEENRQAFNDMITDVAFGMPGDVIYKHHSDAGNDVYMYILSYRPANADSLYPEWMGVPHNGELPHVWGWPLIKLNPELRWHSGILLDVVDWDDTDVMYANYITELWSNFAKTGNPTPYPVAAPDGSMTQWGKFSSNDITYLDIGPTVESKVNYEQTRLAFWREYMPYLSKVDLVRSTPAHSNVERKGMDSGFISNFLSKTYKNSIFNRRY